jgi:hypothetical protein
MSVNNDTVTLTGLGELYEGGAPVGRVDYQLEIMWRDHAGGITRISGRIIAGAVAVDVPVDSRILTLQLDDDVRWDCRLGAHGELTPASEFYRLVEGRRIDI